MGTGTRLLAPNWLGPIASRIRLNAQIELGNWKRVVCPIVVVVVIGQRNLILVSWTIGYVSMLYVCMCVVPCLRCHSASRPPAWCRPGQLQVNDTG